LLIEADLGVWLPDGKGAAGDTGLNPMLGAEDRVLAEEGFLLYIAVQLQVVYVAGAEHLPGRCASYCHPQNGGNASVRWLPGQERGRACLQLIFVHGSGLLAQFPVVNSADYRAPGRRPGCCGSIPAVLGLAPAVLARELAESADMITPGPRIRG
jgi:hypothetical protein